MTEQVDQYTDFTLPPLDTIYQEGSGPQNLAISGPDVGVPSSFVGAAVSGIQAIGSLLTVIETVIPEVIAAIEESPVSKFVTVFDAGLKLASNGLSILESGESTAWGFLTKFFPTTYVYREMLELGLDVKVADIELEPGGTAALDVIDRMLAFAMAMPLLTNAISLMAKIPYAGRWATEAMKGIGELPEEMGLTWAMGMQIDRAFETALGTVIEEGINQQKRGQRIAWQQLRPLFKQHIIKDEKTLRELLARQGFPDEQIDWLIQLGDAMLPVGDLQQMYLSNIITDVEMEDYIGQLGFRPDDVERLKKLYITKAQTGAGALLRQTARALFRDSLISEAQYREYYTATNSPARELDMDVEAINLEHQYGRTRTSATVLKAQYLHGELLGPAAVKQLILNGYTPDNANRTVASWDLPPIAKSHGLSQSRILSYFISGVLTHDQAYTKLQGTNLHPADIDILLAHPRAQSGVVQHRRSPSLVVQAYLDGAIDIKQLDTTLATAGVAPEDIYYWHTIATYRLAHRKGTAASHATLNKGEILDAYKYGVYDDLTTALALEQLGYTAADAMTLMEIKFKGTPPIEVMAQRHPQGVSIADATAYLVAHGYTVKPPPDPLISEYEGLLWSQGYTVLPPPTHTPDTPPAGLA